MTANVMGLVQGTVLSVVVVGCLALVGAPLGVVLASAGVLSINVGWDLRQLLHRRR